MNGDLYQTTSNSLWDTRNYDYNLKHINNKRLLLNVKKIIKYFTFGKKVRWHLAISATDLPGNHNSDCI